MFLQSLYNENILVNINDLNNSLKENNDINDYLLSLLKNKIGNKCNKDGLILSNSLHIIYRNCGQFVFNEKILYKVKYSAKVLFPTEGCILDDCKIIFISSILYIAKMKNTNLIIIIPKNFMKEQFDIKKNKNISVLCLEKYFELNDKYMFIIGIPHINTVKMENINETYENDAICKEVYQNITDFKDEYEKLFTDAKEEDDDIVDIDYELSTYSVEVNEKITSFLGELQKYIEKQRTPIYKINIEILDTITTLDEIYNILDLLNISYVDNLYINFKNQIYNNFNNNIYLLNKNKLSYNDFIQTNNNGTIVNNSNYCYIISVIQILKNSKLFVNHFLEIKKTKQDLDVSTIEYKLYNELETLFDDNNVTNIENLVSILQEYIIKYELQFNFNAQNNTTDFINILFHILNNSSTKLDTSTYIKNVYSDINKDTKCIEQENTENTIGYYINKLNEKNKSNVLYPFCTIEVNEFKCSECLFRYYHIKNKCVTHLNITGSDSIADCIHNLDKEPSYIKQLHCGVCDNNSVYKSSYLHINKTNYFIGDLNRILFKSTDETKNNQDLFINNRINLKIVDTKSNNSILFNNYLLDLKSIIYNKGTISSGHNITLNKTVNDFFYLYDDDKKFIVLNDKFNNFLFRSNVSNVVYQLNNVNSPLSDINLLQYESDILSKQTTKTFDEYMLYNSKLGVHVLSNPDVAQEAQKQFTGGSAPQKIDTFLSKLYRIFVKEEKDLHFISHNDFMNIFDNFYDELWNKYKTEYNKANFVNIDTKYNERNIVAINDFYDINASIITQTENDFYKSILQKYIENMKKILITKQSYIEFLENPSIEFLKDKRIHIGSQGYNTDKTNHWDIIYENSENTLDLYSKHFNTIEISDTYYNNYEESYWSSLQNSLDELEDFSLSILFNKDLSVTLHNLDSIEDEKTVKDVFEKYWNSKMEFIVDYLHNIVFLFESNFEYNPFNLDKIKLLHKIIAPYQETINFVFEFYNDTWYNSTVADFFIENNLSYTTLILNNNNNEFGYNLKSNIDFIISYQNQFKVNYIKLYGSITKFNGSHNKNLPQLINFIKLQNFGEQGILSILNSQKEQYIYFANIETDLYNKRYNPNPDINKLSDETTITTVSNDPDDDELEETMNESETLQTELIGSDTPTENINIPASVFDAKCMCKILNKININ